MFTDWAVKGHDRDRGSQYYISTTPMHHLHHCMAKAATADAVVARVRACAGMQQENYICSTSCSKPPSNASMNTFVAAVPVRPIGSESGIKRGEPCDKFEHGWLRHGVCYEAEGIGTAFAALP